MHEVKPFSFIYEIKNALPADICHDMIRRFEANKGQQYPGRIGQNQAEEASVKKSTDLRISGRERAPAEQKSEGTARLALIKAMVKK